MGRNPFHKSSISYSRISPSLQTAYFGVLRMEIPRPLQIVRWGYSLLPASSTMQGKYPSLSETPESGGQGVAAATVVGGERMGRSRGRPRGRAPASVLHWPGPGRERHVYTRQICRIQIYCVPNIYKGEGKYKY